MPRLAVTPGRMRLPAGMTIPKKWPLDPRPTAPEQLASNNLAIPFERIVAYREVANAMSFIWNSTWWNVILCRRRGHSQLCHNHVMKCVDTSCRIKNGYPDGLF
jgi:hypothetical protein